MDVHELVAHLSWTQGDTRHHADIYEDTTKSGLSLEITAILARVEHERADRVAHALAELLRAQQRPVVLTPTALTALADYIDPNKQFQIGRKATPPHLEGMIAHVWIHKWREFREQGRNKRGLVRMVDEDIIGRFKISPRHLQKIKKIYARQIAEVKSSM